MADNSALLIQIRKTLDSYQTSAQGIEKERDALMKEMRALEVSLSQWTAKCTAMRDRQAGETARRQRLVAELKLQISNMLDARRAIESAEEAQERLAGEQSRAEERLRLADLRREEAERLLEAKNQNLMERRVKEADLRARLQKAEEDRKRYERSL